MNSSGTSGTFSPSSLLYYHFSRFFDTTVKVPVIVYRTMDTQAHFQRVTHRAHTGKMGKGSMNQAGWQALFQAEQNPASYRTPNELFTEDRRQIFGVLGDAGGERYGPEINGIRSSWGDKQNEDFQRTPAFYALRSEKPLKEAITEGLELGQRDAKVKKAMGGGASEFQMAVWMKELSEIVLLDYIFNQQDRIGNIDYKWYVYYLDEKGKVKSDKLESELPRENMSKVSYPKDVNGSPTQLVQRTRIIDNDAGAKVQYTNFTKRTQMLEKIRHLAPATYQKLIALNRDLQSRGQIYTYLRDNFRLDDRQLAQIVDNVSEAANIFRNSCVSRKLNFDLASVKTAFKGGITPTQLNCDNP